MGRLKALFLRAEQFFLGGHMKALEKVWWWLLDTWDATPYKREVIVFLAGFVLGALVF